MFKKVRHFFREYKHLGWILIAALTALVLDVAGKDVWAHWILGITAIVSVFPLLWGMAETLREGSYGVDILAATAIITAVILHEYWAAIIIVVMLTGGEALEDYAEHRAQSELGELMDRTPKIAHVTRGRKTIDVPVHTVREAERLEIRVGEIVPVDCIVLEGTSSFDESSLTGESLPVERTLGDTILSGSINLDGAVTAKALHTAADSQFQQIVKMVRGAASTQSPFVRLADRYSIPFTIVSFMLASGMWYLTKDSRRFLEVLVVATPCPLLLGAPIALISGMSRAAKHGIIVKTGSAIERLGEIKTIGFDKTGTLTVGKPVVHKIYTFSQQSAQEVLKLAASLEQSSNHILAQAMNQEAAGKKIKLAKVKGMREYSGLGLSGSVERANVIVGKWNFMLDQNVDIPKSTHKKLPTDTSAFVAVDGALIGAITFTDELRHNSKLALERIHEAGITHTLMLTGDNEYTAQKIAKQLGISDVRANCLPGDKLLALEALTDRPIAFVGDGINDAPVLTASDVGIALGARGSTIASESADVVIMQDDISRVADSIEIAQDTFRIAKQSILTGIFLSVGLMFIFATGKFKPVLGAALQELVDVSVILYALRAHGPWEKPVRKKLQPAQTN